MREVSVSWEWLEFIWERWSIFRRNPNPVAGKTLIVRAVDNALSSLIPPDCQKRLKKYGP
jgi:hypothetical protein